VITFSIANDDESRRSVAGEYEKVTSWFDITYWTKKPQHWLQQLFKGVMVVVECDVSQDTWTDANTGNSRSKIKFTVKRGSYPIVVPKTTQQSTGNGEQARSYNDAPDDDIPF
jgi:single-stranded DNA-binding protein